MDKPPSSLSKTVPSPAAAAASVENEQSRHAVVWLTATQCHRAANHCSLHYIYVTVRLHQASYSQDVQATQYTTSSMRVASPICTSIAFSEENCHPPTCKGR